MSAVTIEKANPWVVTWRVGNSLTIESHREAVEQWADEADFMGHADVDGLTLTRGDLANMRAALDDAWAARCEKRRERASDFESNWSAS